MEATLLKTKCLRANYSKFMTKKLTQAIMLRTKLRYQFLKIRHQKLQSVS